MLSVGKANVICGCKSACMGVFLTNKIIERKDGDLRMSRRRLNEKQLAAIALLSVPKRGGLTYKQIAEEVGVTEQTLHNWRKLDHFNEEIKKQVLRNSIDRLPEIFDSVPDHITKEGNAAMFRTYLQSLGMLTEKVEVESKSNDSDVDSIKAEIERMQARRKSDG